MRTLWPFLLANSLAAQFAPELQVAALPGGLEARVQHATPGALVALLLGLEHAATPLPGGALLALAPAAVQPHALADQHGNATFPVPIPGSAPGVTSLLAQALVFDPAPVANGPFGLQATGLLPVTLHRAGDVADVVVLFGQSNAEGFAPLAGLPGGLRGPLPLLRTWNPYHARWEALHAGVNNMLVPQAQRAGPELGLASALAGADRPVWLVKMALPQTALGPWPGPWNEWGPRAGEIYPLLLAHVAAATGALRATGLVPRVRLVALVLGECDSLDSGLAQQFGDNLAELAIALRGDLAAADLVGDEPPWFCPAVLPAALFQLGFSHVELVRGATTALAGILPRVRPIGMDELPMLGDGVHLSLEGVLRLGAAFLADERR
ncbi:MAG: sialate O-acetylesterase [Planctomycetes bacterium]|nr:sialate O-acetylesterase [Planctomycetota bacterium]